MKLSHHLITSYPLGQLVAILTSFFAYIYTATTLMAEVEILEAEVVPVGKDWQIGFLEGPAPGKGNLLYFTNRNRDPNAEQGIQQVDLAKPELGATTVHTTRAGGLWYRNGILRATVPVKNGDSRVVQFEGVDGKSAFADPRNLVSGKIHGRGLVAPNDLVRDAKGGTYFTDKNGKALYYISPGGKTNLVADYKDDGSTANDTLEELNNPNGIILSPDGSTLYVTDNSNILHAKIASPGKLAAPLAHLLPGAGITEKPYHKIAGISPAPPRKNGRPAWIGKYGGNMNIDGMTVDAEGTIYGAGLSSGIVFGWDGKTCKLVRIVKCPGGAVNCTIARAGRNLLCVVGSFGIATVKLPTTAPLE